MPSAQSKGRTCTQVYRGHPRPKVRQVQIVVVPGMVFCSSRSATLFLCFEGVGGPTATCYLNKYFVALRQTCTEFVFFFRKLGLGVWSILFGTSSRLNHRLVRGLSTCSSNIYTFIIRHDGSRNKSLREFRIFLRLAWFWPSTRTARCCMPGSGSCDSPKISVQKIIR